MSFNYNAYLADSIFYFLFKSAELISTAGGVVHNTAIQLDTFRKAKNTIDSLEKVWDNPHYSPLQKEALSAMVVVSEFGMFNYGANSLATFEMYWNAINNVPPIFGGGTREDYYAKLAADFPDIFVLAGDGNLLEPLWIQNLATHPLMRQLYT